MDFSTIVDVIPRRAKSYREDVGMVSESTVTEW